MRFALMIEPQQAITWDQHVLLTQRAEKNGFETLYRSDHYDSFPGPAGRTTTDAFAVIAGLVRETSRIRHGTMVSPVTFRPPGNVAKVVATIDEMSGGRIELGLGAGWNLEEHRRHGYAFPDMPTRLEMLEEQLQVIGGLFSGQTGWSFEGKHYQVSDTHFAPLPVQSPRAPLIVGTQGKKRAISMAARLADHLNLYYCDPEAAGAAFKVLDDECRAIGRDPGEVTRSVLLGTVVGEDAADLSARRDAIVETFEYAGSSDEWQAENDHVWLVGPETDVKSRVDAYAAAGADLIVFQDFLPYDLPFVDILGDLVRRWSA